MPINRLFREGRCSDLIFNEFKHADRELRNVNKPTI
jgi:hypothetical protein